MRIRQQPWHFTADELEWLGSHAYTNELAADILYRYTLRYGRPGPGMPGYRRRKLTGWLTKPHAPARHD